MARLARIRQVDLLDGLALRLSFDDGVVRDLDLDEMLQGGGLDELRDAELFAQVRVDRSTGTLAWHNGVELDPDVLHGDFEPATGAGPTVLAERRP